MLHCDFFQQDRALQSKASYSLNEFKTHQHAAAEHLAVSLPGHAEHGMSATSRCLLIEAQTNTNVRESLFTAALRVAVSIGHASHHSQVRHHTIAIVSLCGPINGTNYPRSSGGARDLVNSTLQASRVDIQMHRCTGGNGGMLCVVKQARK